MSTSSVIPNLSAAAFVRVTFGLFLLSMFFGSAYSQCPDGASDTYSPTCEGFYYETVITSDAYVAPCKGSIRTTLTVPEVRSADYVLRFLSNASNRSCDKLTITVDLSSFDSIPFFHYAILTQTDYPTAQCCIFHQGQLLSDSTEIDLTDDWSALNNARITSLYLDVFWGQVLPDINVTVTTLCNATCSDNNNADPECRDHSGN